MFKIRFTPSVWFSAPIKGSLFAAFLQTSIKTKIRFMRRVDFYSVAVSLNKPEEELFKDIKKSTRNEIRRASKEGVKCGLLSNTVEGLKIHKDYYEKNGLGSVSVDRYLNDLQVRVTVAMYQAKVISVHTYLLCDQKKIVRLLFSSTIPIEYGVEGNVVGWANRSLHWYDIKYFKAMGFDIYDFGGIAVGDKLDSKTEKINRFKKLFGGEIVVYYNYFGLVRYALLATSEAKKRIEAFFR